MACRKLTEEQICEMLARINENTQYHWNNNIIHLLMSSLLIIKETNGIDLRINYLGAIYTNLKFSAMNILSLSQITSLFSNF